MRRRRFSLNRKLPGFAMIEVVAALAITTIFSTYFVSTILSLKRAHIDSTTKHNADLVLRYMANYVAQNGALPYPGRPETGQEIDHAETEQDWETAPERYMRGIVPYKTLGLDHHYVRDGYGTYFTYIVNPCLCRRKDVQSVPPGDIRELTEHEDRLMYLRYEGSHNPLRLVYADKERAGNGDIDTKVVLGPYASYNAVRSYDAKYRTDGNKDATSVWDIATRIPQAQIRCIEHGQEIVLQRYMNLIPPLKLTCLDNPIPLVLNFIKQIQGERIRYIMALDDYMRGMDLNQDRFRVNDCIAVVLISHGKSRGGAFRDDGAVYPVLANASQEKRANSNDTSEKNLCYLNKQADSAGEFDDRVFWVSRFGLGTRDGSFTSKPFQIIGIPFEKVDT